MNPCVVILKVGAEGGSVTLFGIRTAEGWHFSRDVIDQTPELLDEPRIQHDSVLVNGWPQALKLLDEYPWPHLYPLEVHAEFRSDVLDAVLARYKAENDTNPRRLSKWEELCGSHGVVDSHQ